MLKKKLLFKLGIALLVILLGIWIWGKFGSTTKVALVNFPGFQATGIALSNQSSHVEYEQIGLEEIDRYSDYDCVLVFGMGVKWDEAQLARVTQMTEEGFPLQVIYATTPETNIMGLDSIQGKRILEYLDSGSKKNYQNLALYIRKYVDKKSWFAPEPEAWVEGASDVFYHLDESVAYRSKDEFDAYLRQNGYYHEGAPKVLIVGGFTDPFSGAKENLDSLIKSLDQSGLNVYPVTSFSKRLEFIQEVKPDLIVYLAHGRLLMGQGERAVEYLKELNVPMIAPLTILQSQKEWEANPMGMVGGFMSQTIVMPELDGSIYPYALFTQEKTDAGYEVLRAIPERLKTFTSLVNRFVQLKKKPNAEKKLAIYFFKGPGQETLAAQGLETVPSLYNTLLRLKQEGYNLEGLPDNVADFQRDLSAQGQVFKPYAEGKMRQFVEEVKPDLISGKELEQWIKTDLNEELQNQLLQDYGPAPGSYMIEDKDGTPHLIVSRLRYGNVVLLPQPMAGIGSDSFAIAHGAKMPPPYPYVGAYLWARHAFGADAIMHFGTHGSLEFTPSKQVALGNNDWADQLLSDVPHFYYYTIGNIGESMMAKRRSYATTISYITPAFNPSGARGVYAELQTAIRKYYDASSTESKKALAISIKKHAMALGIHRELRLDSIASKPYTDDEIEKIDNFAEEISSEKVNASLYTTGEVYTPERLRSTVIAMSVDPIAYAKAKLDAMRSKDKVDYTKHQRLFNQKYHTPANALVEQILAGKVADEALVLAYTGVSKEELERAKELTTPKQRMGMMGGGKPKAEKGLVAKSNKKSTGGHPAWIPKIGGGHPPHIPKTGTKPAMPPQADSAQKSSDKTSDMMAKHRDGAMAAEEKISKEEIDKAHLIVEAERAILNVNNYKVALQTSPTLELDGIVDALSGGYIAPSSGGDAIANPQAVPTGRNLYSISAESTPSERAWSKGVLLVEQTLKEYHKRHGKYPTKVSYTFWSSEFIESQGASIAQALYMLGVEPIRDSFGRVSDLRLIPAAELGRPRIDIVIQTSGQFRDLAASRLALITRAIEMVAAAPKDEQENYVAEGAVNTEKLLVDAGISPKDARELSTKRIFGGINGMYGTGIQEMITAGDKWDDESEIADVYLNNMGASYSTIEDWGKYSKPLFRAALANTDVVIQPRQSNTWGALSLDHVYEFMGGLTLTVRNVTGKDPDTYFADYRNRNNFRMQDLKEAIGVESRATILNPAFVKEMMQGGASSLGRITEIATNTYGWNVSKPEVIEDALWREMYQIYVEDKFNLNIPKTYEEVNPQAMQEITAVMLETIRKGMWQATEEEISKLVQTHADLTQKFGATGGGMASSNQKLQQFIAQRLSPEQAKQFEQKQREVREANKAEAKDGVVMSKNERTLEEDGNTSKGFNGFIVAGVSLVVFIALVLLLRRKRKNNQ
ncbi:MAG: cobaltochelatase subunit CobN [Porphyromonadaceae bacterium]|nr:cobaltochelatase subunit CobN [Porphyromonadaceae bacterium]